MSKYFLAIDGGNSKTDVILGDSTGAVHGFVRGPGSSPQTLGMERAMKLLATLIHESGASDVEVERAEVYLAGVDLPEEAISTAKAVEEMGWARSSRVDNDSFALLRAGTDLPDAVAVVCGAGTNCVGRAGDGRLARFPALGMISGDWGGGQHLAQLALWHAVRAEDGRGPATALVSAVAGHCGRDTVAEVVAGVHLGTISRERIDSLSPVLFAVAAAGDEVARRVVTRQADEVVALATVAADRLDLRSRRYAVVLGGGVLRAGHPLLIDPIRTGVLAHSPQAELVVVADPPVLGAGLHALDALAAAPPAAAALRSALSLTSPRRIVT